jgi:hypothetical protein
LLLLLLIIGPIQEVLYIIFRVVLTCGWPCGSSSSDQLPAVAEQMCAKALQLLWVAK